MPTLITNNTDAVSVLSCAAWAHRLRRCVAAFVVAIFGPCLTVADDSADDKLRIDSVDVTAIDAANKLSPYYSGDMPQQLEKFGILPFDGSQSVPPALSPVNGQSIVPTQYIGGPASDPSGAVSPGAPAWQPSVIASPEINPWKPGWLKNAQSTFSYVPASSPTDLGFVGLDQRVSLKTRHPFLTINPRFGILWTEGPESPAPTLTAAGIDVPGQLFDASVEARWFQPINQNWVFEVAVSPGFYSDGENTSSDSLRIVGRALAFYKLSEAVRIGFGAVYLDRDDVNVLPAVGMMIYPNYDTKLELTFPRPRLAYRIQQRENFDRWAYVAGEFGGGQWAIERNLVTPSAGPFPIARRGNDVIRYRDYRLLFGVEHKSKVGPGWLVEGGFLFGREVEYESGQGDKDLDASAIVRLGLTF